MSGWKEISSRLQNSDPCSAEELTGRIALRDLITWNMQGANWNDVGTGAWYYVERWFETYDDLDVCCLQECGRVRLGTEVESINSIRVYKHNAGTSSRPQNLWIYFHEWDTGSGRVNLAIVSRYQADRAKLFTNTLNENLRKLLGICIGNYWIFAIHALSGSGNDAPGFIRHVQKNYSSESWIIAGDYNQTPDDLTRKLQDKGINVTVCPPNLNTHNARNSPTKMLDYAVWSQNQSTTGNVLGLQVTGGAAQSDHLPVQYAL